MCIYFSFELNFQVSKRNREKTKTLKQKDCKEKLKDYSSLYQKRARSLERRLTRIGFWITFLQRKIKRKDEFHGSYKILLSALGGNESAPTCNGDKNTKYAGKHFQNLIHYCKNL